LASLRALQGYDRRWVETSVGRVHVLERNSSGYLPPVVLLHGLSSAGCHYVHVTRHLRATSRVVLPDLPGHGFSDVPSPLNGTTLLTGLVESLDKVIDRPAVLAGNSLGGYTAIRYALARPEKVAGLMLVAPTGAAMCAEDLDELRRRFTLKKHSDAVRFVDNLFHERKLARHLYAVGLRAYFSLPQTLAVLEEMQLPWLFTPEQMQSLKMPVLFIWGESERLLPRQCLEFFQAHLPKHARQENAAGWGHGGFLDDPKGFATRLLRFAADIALLERQASGRAPPVTLAAGVSGP
jgi:pimeloyl-ACP methyl ester carboxylesterase